MTQFANTIEIKNSKKTEARIYLSKEFNLEKLVDKLVKKINRERKQKEKETEYSAVSASLSEDQKRIVFNCRENKSFYFNLIDSTLYHKDNNKFTENDCHNITTCFDEIESKEDWLKLFLNILEFNFSWVDFVDKKDKARIVFFEQVVKYITCSGWYTINNKEYINDLVQEIGELACECFYFYKGDIKSFVKTFDWFFSDNVNNHINHYGLLNVFRQYECFSKKSPKLMEFFKHTVENYILSDDEADIFTGLIEVTDTLIKMDYDPVRLSDYIFRDFRNQGLTYSDDIYLLRDYARMCFKTKKDFEKYPRYLKTYHDIASHNEAMLRKTALKAKIKKIVKKLSSYEYKNEKFSLISPKSLEDIVQEGRSLNHCVASYCDEFSEGETIIMFLRSNDNLSTPLVTVEIRNNKIVQAKGKNNRNTVLDEIKFLQEYQKFLLQKNKT
jgi:hypothetical protein